MAGSLIFVGLRIFTSCFRRTWDNFYRWHGISASRQSVVIVWMVLPWFPAVRKKSIFDPVTRRRHVHWMVFRLRASLAIEYSRQRRKKKTCEKTRSKSIPAKKPEMIPKWMWLAFWVVREKKRKSFFKLARAFFLLFLPIFLLRNPVR